MKHPRVYLLCVLLQINDSAILYRPFNCGQSRRRRHP